MICYIPRLLFIFLKVDAAQSYPCPEASPESSGHSGFTGTFVWIDPVYRITYIFLSNRVYPTRDNNLIGKLNVRTDILSAIYKCIIEQPVNE